MLNEITFQHEYRSGRDDLVDSLYGPALARCTEYWRAVGFFSSSALETIGQPLGDFVSRGGTMKLITSVMLEEQDVKAIEDGLSRQAACEKRILEQIRAEFVSPLGKGASLLAKMLEAGCLEIKIATPRTGKGIYHEKVGAFIGTDSVYVAFSGSTNESWTALECNYECIDVYTSWTDSTRAALKLQHFKDLWDGVAAGTETYTFPEAAKLELLRIRRRYESDHRALPSPGLLTSQREKWAHQQDAIRAFLSAERGVLEMATGTGKTRTALKISEQLVLAGAIDSLIVAADGNDLLDQWYRELARFCVRLPTKFAVCRQYGPHKERASYQAQPKNLALLTSRQNLEPALSSLTGPQASKTLLVHDEVHRLGSPGNRQALDGKSDGVRFRLGLSATPEREYDQDGTAFITKHVGAVIFRFDLSNAIRGGILVPFNYFPVEWTPDAEDKSRVHAVYKKAAAKKAAGAPMKQSEIWTDIAHVYKTSKVKLPLLADFLASHAELLTRCIIFCETKEYGQEVLDIVHRHRVDFHTYFDHDDPKELQRFARGDLECLVTCHRLSEGIDIRSINAVILLSSARAQLETVQRIGRCLRCDPGQPDKRANIVDFIRANEPDNPSDTTADAQRRRWLTTLSQISPEDAQ